MGPQVSTDHKLKEPKVSAPTSVIPHESQAAETRAPSPFEMWKALTEEYGRLRDHARTITLLGVAAMGGVIVANTKMDGTNAPYWICPALLVMMIVHTGYLHFSIRPRQRNLGSVAGALEGVFRPSLAVHQRPLISGFAYFGPSKDGGKEGQNPLVGLLLLSVVFNCAGLVAICVVGPWRDPTGRWVLPLVLVTVTAVLVCIWIGAALNKWRASERPGGDSNARPAA